MGRKRHAEEVDVPHTKGGNGACRSGDEIENIDLIGQMMTGTPLEEIQSQEAGR